MCFGSSVAHSYGINYASFRLSYEQKFTIKYFLVSYTVFDSIIYVFFCVSLLIILVTKFFDVTPYDSPFQNLMFLLTAWVSCSFFSTWARESETFVQFNWTTGLFFPCMSTSKIAICWQHSREKIDSFSNGEKSRNSIRNLMGHFQVRTFRMPAKFLLVFDYSRLDECVKQ